MKILITFLTSFSLLFSVNAQSFLAGFDFDDLGLSDTSVSSNWGTTSATLSFDHAAANFVTKFSNDWQTSGSYDSPVVGINFINGVDPLTGYSSFAGNDTGAAMQGINFVGPGTVTINWGLALTDTGTVSYSKLEGGSWTTETVSVNSGETSYAFSANGFGIDNIQLIGTVVPEPSTYALILGFAAFLLGAMRKRQ